MPAQAGIQFFLPLPNNWIPAYAGMTSVVERAMGIEPTSLAWEARVIPVYDARIFAHSTFHQATRCIFSPYIRSISAAKRSSMTLRRSFMVAVISPFSGVHASSVTVTLRTLA